jgi:hypothetical protein
MTHGNHSAQTDVLDLEMIKRGVFTMTQTIFDRCLIFFAFVIVLLAVLAGCTPETAVSPTTPDSSPTDTPTSREQYDEPLIGELSFEERPSHANPDTPTINLILINATLTADDDKVSIDGRGLETPLRQLDHCGNFFFDGDQLTIAGNPLPSRATYTVLMDYSGISLSTGGSNTRENILNSDATEYPVPLALDTDFTFYTIDLGDPYTINLWQGEQTGNQITTIYRRPVEGQFGQVTLSESHDITILHNVPVTYRDSIECE